MSRFLITFDDLHDPRPEVVKLIRRRLKPTPVELVTPGVLAVDSDESTVRSAVRDLPEWHVAQEGLLSDTPPAQGRFSRRG